LNVLKPTPLYLKYKIDGIVKSYVIPRCGTVTENNFSKNLTVGLFIV
jgi:hypothetical protein